MSPDELDAIEAILPTAREAVAYAYMAGEPPPDLPRDVDEFIAGDGGTLRLYDLAASLIVALREAWAEVERLTEDAATFERMFREALDGKREAEAAVARVRALCDGEWLWSVPITYITAALDGGDDE